MMETLNLNIMQAFYETEPRTKARRLMKDLEEFEGNERKRLFVVAAAFSEAYISNDMSKAKEIYKEFDPTNLDKVIKLRERLKKLYDEWMESGNYDNGDQTFAPYWKAFIESMSREEIVASIVATRGSSNYNDEDIVRQANWQGLNIALIQRV